MSILINLAAVNFEDYLISKKIDAAAFLSAEPQIWKVWKSEFEQVHPNSFTTQKLYLINPIRRKYPLKQEPLKPEIKSESPTAQNSGENAVNPDSPIANTRSLNPKPAISRPIFKPKQK